MTFELHESDEQPEAHVHPVRASLPRLLDVGLTVNHWQDPIVDALSNDLAALDPSLQGSYLAAVADARLSHLRELRGVDPACPPSIAETVAMLDRIGTETVGARDLASMLLLIFGDPADRDVCARLAVECRAAMARLTPRSLAAEAAARLNLGPVGDWRSIATLAVQHERRLADEGDAGLEPRFARAAQIEAWRVAAEDLLQKCHALVIGLSCMATGQLAAGYNTLLAEQARNLGYSSLRPAAQLAEDRAANRYARMMDAERRHREDEKAEKAETKSKTDVVPPGTVLVCPSVKSTGKKELIAGYEKVLGVALPLVRTPDLEKVQASLDAEFPHCAVMTAGLLRNLAGKEFVELRPLLMRGNPGSGKSRYIRRLGEALGVGVFRVDGSGDAGVSFAGTERRWYSTEPCRPFMACARHMQANPFVFIDEIDKAPTRTDYGRLWDGILSFMERETAQRFQDPSLQVELDLGHVSIVATANDVSKLPGPLLDRFGAVLRMPDPGPQHLEVLAASLARELAARQGLDERFVEPFDGYELAAMRRVWRGGSVRRLGRVVAGTLRARDRLRPKSFH